ncbi:unannotated protein [freshwater metagenome]|uniref:Unannotated protein n=1 Tax=freshwater metagenome TaxID=449393 RepID=A0A6J6YLA4_9ZZZZ
MTFSTAATASLGTVIVSSETPATTTVIVSSDPTGPTVPPKPVRVSRIRTGFIGTKTAPSGTTSKPDAGVTSLSPTPATMPDAINNAATAAVEKRASGVFIFRSILRIPRGGETAWGILERCWDFRLGPA